MNNSVKSYQELLVWQKGMLIVKTIYELTSQFPKEEIYGLTAQMRRSAVSIPSNIAEGRSRSTRKDFIQFLKIASGSLAELETQVLIAQEIGFLKNEQTIVSMLDEKRRMLHSMMKKLQVGTVQKLSSS